MSNNWNLDELVEHFSLLPSELKFIGRNLPHNQLGKAILLKFFQQHSRFPENLSEIDPMIIEYVAQ